MGPIPPPSQQKKRSMLEHEVSTPLSVFSKLEKRSLNLLRGGRINSVVIADDNGGQGKGIYDASMRKEGSERKKKRKRNPKEAHGELAPVTEDDGGQGRGNDGASPPTLAAKRKKDRKRSTNEAHAEKTPITDANEIQGKGNAEDEESIENIGRRRESRKRKRKIKNACTEQPLVGVQEKGNDNTSIHNKRRRRKIMELRRKNKKMHHEQALNSALEATCEAIENQNQKVVKGKSGLSAPRPKPKSNGLLDKMRAQLSGGQFRMLNEMLYTCCGEDAFRMFKEDPTSFELYHAGYQEQISKWPQSPVEVVIDWLQTKEPRLIVADFGCGDARLAKSVTNEVHSFDLVSSDPSVIACNMSRTPLSAASVDVAVFCLSLMGTNYPEYLSEAHRILKLRGWMLIAEVKSRFDVEHGGTDVEQFVKALKELGFHLLNKDDTNKMFVIFYFRKQGGGQRGRITWPKLKPCLYKRR